MKKLTLILSIGIATALSLFATDRQSSEEAFSLHYVSAETAFGLLKGVDPDYAPALKSFNARLNLIMLDPSHPKLNEIRKILVEIDQRPKQIVYYAVVSESIRKGTEVEERILSRPTVRTLEGKPATFTISLSDGRILKVSVTAEAVGAKDKSAAKSSKTAD